MADDHPLMRVGISHLVRQEWPDAQIDEAPTIAEALARIAAAPRRILRDEVRRGEAADKVTQNASGDEAAP